jgi:hypothetical protein
VSLGIGTPGLAPPTTGNATTSGRPTRRSSAASSGTRRRRRSEHVPGAVTIPLRPSNDSASVTSRGVSVTIRALPPRRRPRPSCQVERVAGPGPAAKSPVASSPTPTRPTPLGRAAVRGAGEGEGDGRVAGGEAEAGPAVRASDDELDRSLADLSTEEIRARLRVLRGGTRGRMNRGRGSGRRYAPMHAQPARVCERCLTRPGGVRATPATSSRSSTRSSSLCESRPTPAAGPEMLA